MELDRILAECDEQCNEEHTRRKRVGEREREREREGEREKERGRGERERGGEREREREGERERKREMEKERCIHVDNSKYSLVLNTHSHIVHVQRRLLL